MLAYCTYCSADKTNSESPLAAIELYKSSRITNIYTSAKEAGVSFVILSGKHGIIDASEKFAYYDHLLVPAEVEAHAALVASQLKKKGVTKLAFYTASVLKDPNVKAYINCITLACANNRTTLEIKVLD